MLTDFVILWQYMPTLQRIRSTSQFILSIVFCLLLSTHVSEAHPLEIPYVPMEISTFPDSLKTFCSDTTYGLKEVCSKLIASDQLNAYDYMAFRYAWGHERELKDNAGVQKKILGCIASKSKDPSIKCRNISKDMVAETDPNRQFIELLSGAEVPAAPAGAGDTLANVFPEGAPSSKATAKETLPSLEEQFILGLAEFIISRAKAEAAYYYQSTLRDRLCNDNREYFPNLCVALDSLDLSLSLNAMTGYLRSAIKKDIENIPDVYLTNAAYSACTKGERETAEIFLASRLVYAAYEASKTGALAIDIFRGISEVQFKTTNTKNQVCELKGDPADIKNLLSNIQISSVLMRAFEQNAYIRDANNKPVLRDWSDKNDRLYIMAGFALTFEYLMKKYDQPLIYTKKLNPRPFIHLIKTTDHLSSTMGRLKHIYELEKLIQEPVITNENTKSYDPKLRLPERLMAMNTMLEMLDDLAVESYELAAYGNSDSQVMQDLHSKFAKVREASVVAQGLLRGDDAAYMVAFLSIASDKTKVGDGNVLTSDIKSVIPVMVEITKAQTSKDVANVLEAAAAPVASYRQKDKRSMTSVTALFGAGLGGKEIYYLNGQREEHSLGIQAFAPIGVHLTTPASIFGWHTSLGGFVSLIDLGPLVSTRNESGVESQPNVGFKQIFSPGLYVTFHLVGPFNIGYGIAKTPDLLKSTTGQDITEWRHQVFIAMDLTLFPF